MPAYLFLQGIQGEATDANHLNWININSMSSPISRSIQQGAKDQMRARGETTLGDVIVSRELDKSSVKVAQACAAGTFYQSATIDFCSTLGGKQVTYLRYLLKSVIVTSYSLHAVGDSKPSEQISLGFTAVDWTYTQIDPNTGNTVGNVPAGYNPGTGTQGA